MFPQELAQKIKGYQEQIAALNSKCKMLTRNATMLLTVTEVEGLAEDLDRELLPATSAHPSVVMVSKGHRQVCRARPSTLFSDCTRLPAPGSLWLVLGTRGRSCRLEPRNSLLNSLLHWGQSQCVTL